MNPLKHLARLCLLGTALLAAPLLASEPRPLQWSELIPADAPASSTPEVQHGTSGEDAPAAVQTGTGAPVVAALDGQSVRLPGYLVPLEVSGDGQLRVFLLVPWYGACIHVPPPPSNQIVLVDSTQAPGLAELWRPYWVTGVLRAETSTSELAEAGYRMSAAQVEPYPLQ